MVETRMSAAQKLSGEGSPFPQTPALRRRIHFRGDDGDTPVHKSQASYSGSSSSSSITAVVQHPSPCSAASLFNCFIMFAVMIPPFVSVIYLQRNCTLAVSHTSVPWAAALQSKAQFLQWNCSAYVQRPFEYLNILVFVFIDVAFYVIYLLQGSTWLIDPHWQFIPSMIALYYFYHPHARTAHTVITPFFLHNHSPRALIALVFVCVWAIRLLFNYFRREGWQCGGREDWRYGDMRRQHGKWWIVSQFFAVSIAQHAMLVGLTMPLQSIMFIKTNSINAMDWVAFCCCVSGILIGHFADSDLHEYMLKKKKPLVLNEGLWFYSRHPNHFGEQLYWIGLLFFGVATSFTGDVASLLSLSTWWPICLGVLFNHSIDTLVTLPLIEERMLRREDRRKEFEEYQRTTSLLFPLPKRE